MVSPLVPGLVLGSHSVSAHFNSILTVCPSCHRGWTLPGFEVPLSPVFLLAFCLILCLILSSEALKHSWPKLAHVLPAAQDQILFSK